MSDQDGLDPDTNGQVEAPASRPITKSNAEAGGVSPAVAKPWREGQACTELASGRFKLSVFRQPDGATKWCLQDETSTENFTLPPDMTRALGLVLLGPTAGRPLTP